MQYKIIECKKKKAHLKWDHKKYSEINPGRHFSSYYYYFFIRFFLYFYAKRKWGGIILGKWKVLGILQRSEVEGNNKDKVGTYLLKKRRNFYRNLHPIFFFFFFLVKINCLGKKLWDLKIGNWSLGLNNLMSKSLLTCDHSWILFGIVSVHFHKHHIPNIV